MKEIKPEKALIYKINGFTITSTDLDEDKFSQLCHDMMHNIVNIYKKKENDDE